MKCRASTLCTGYYLSKLRWPGNEFYLGKSENKLLGQHIPRKYFSQRQAEDEALPEEAKTKTSVYGASLLSGILYCAHCGCKLIGTYCTKQRKNGAYHRPIYRCYNGSVKAKHCDGQTVYSAAKIEAAVLEVVHQYFRNITKTVSGVWEEQTRIQLKSKIAYQLKAARAEREKLVVQEERLRQEVMRSIMGESNFDTELLKKEMLEKNKADLAAFEARLVELEDEKGAEESRMKYLSTQYELINDWAAEFDAADNDTKKMILARLIEKITVDKDDHLNSTFYVAADSFRTQIAQEKPLIQIDEAERCIPAIAV